METKEIKITPPEGYCIDTENSTFEYIKFKRKGLTYEDIAKYLFAMRYFCYIDTNGCIKETVKSDIIPTDGNAATSKKQLEKLLAINKLMNVAKYLNGDWKPDWNGNQHYKFFIVIYRNNDIGIDSTDEFNSRVVYFENQKLAQQAIDILGEDTIRLALSTDW